MPKSRISFEKVPVEVAKKVAKAELKAKEASRRTGKNKAALGGNHA